MAYSAQQTLREQIDDAFNDCAKRHNGQEPDGHKQVIDLLVKDESLCRFCLQPVVFGYDIQDDKFCVSHRCSQSSIYTRYYSTANGLHILNELAFPKDIAGFTAQSHGLGDAEYLLEDGSSVRFVKRLLDKPILEMVKSVLEAVSLKRGSENPQVYYTIYPQKGRANRAEIDWVCKHHFFSHQWITFVSPIKFDDPRDSGRDVYWPATIKRDFLDGLSQKFTPSFEKNFGKHFERLEDIPF